MSVELSVQVDPEDIVAAIAYGYGESDPIKFVLSLDEYVGDEGFTEGLLLALAQSYLECYSSLEESVASMVLEDTFAEGDASRARKRSAELDEVTSKREKLSNIVSILKSLD